MMNFNHSLGTSAMMDASNDTGALTPDAIFSAYEHVRPQLPSVDFTAVCPGSHSSLLPLLDQYDVFVFDAFGVLNVGEQTIPGAVACLQTLQAAHKEFFVLTNGASLTQTEALKRLQRLGFDLHQEQIISSRHVLRADLAQWPAGMRWGAMLPPRATISDLPEGLMLPDDPNFLSADGFLFMSSEGWTPQWQTDWVGALRQSPRPVLLGNPDLAAPYEGYHAPTPGYYCLYDLPVELRALVKGYGKPFGNAFELLKQHIARQHTDPLPPKVLMVGDTLHTDILGGANAGFDTALVTGHGAHKGLDIQHCMAASGIVPTWLLPGI